MLPLINCTEQPLCLRIVINLVAEIKVLKTWLVAMKNRSNNNVETFKGNLFITCYVCCVALSAQILNLILKIMSGNNDYLSRKEPCNIHGVRVSTYIICSAIHFVNTKTYPHQPKNIKTGLVIAGRRHHNVFTNMSALGADHKDYDAVVQGFLTNDDRFVDREEGGRIAYEAQQIDKPTKMLFSEDLY